jgi:hypothetical protein
MTRMSIANTNSDSQVKKRGKPWSCSMYPFE